tara:strand:- start:190 stop:315 length:126 start_codon:yes stop_codon:yes gene_type:complete
MIFGGVETWKSLTLLGSGIGESEKKKRRLTKQKRIQNEQNN